MLGSPHPPWKWGVKTILPYSHASICWFKIAPKISEHMTDEAWVYDAEGQHSPWAHSCCWREGCQVWCLGAECRRSADTSNLRKWRQKPRSENPSDGEVYLTCGFDSARPRSKALLQIKGHEVLLTCHLYLMMKRFIIRMGVVSSRKTPPPSLRDVCSLIALMRMKMM